MRKYIMIFLLVLIVFLSGCSFVGEVEEWGCFILSGKTEDHCYKDAAIRQNDPDTCDRIKGKSKEVGIAPKNECYRTLAVNNRDASVCDRINQTNFISVTKSGCQDSVKKLGCRYDSDCKPVCEGNVFWKQGCDLKTNKCIKTFDTECESETIASTSFQKKCTIDGCMRDKVAISHEYELKKEKINQYTKDMQRLNEMQQQSTKNCLSALNEVTNKLIIDTSLRVVDPLPSLADIGAGATVDIIDKLTETKMSAEEFISLNCNLQKALTTDIKLVDKKRQILLDEEKELKDAMDD